MKIFIFLISDFVFAAVRTGNLAKFNEVLAKFGSKFQAEDTYTLIIRLRHNVIKTGVRMINLSYSRISLMDIAQKLMLDSPEDAEYIVAKVCFKIAVITLLRNRLHTGRLPPGQLPCILSPPPPNTLLR